MRAVASVVFHTILSQALAFRVRVENLARTKRLEVGSGCSNELQDEFSFNHPFNLQEFFRTGTTLQDKPARDWEIAKDIVIFGPNSIYPSWGDVLTKETYLLEMERLKELTWQGRPLLDYPVSNNLRGVCDLSIASFQEIVHSTVFLRYMRSYAPSCARLTNGELVSALRTALDSMCFDSCMNALRQKQASDDPAAYDSDWFLGVFTETEDCLRVPWDTVEDLADLTLKQRLSQFPPPSPLWIPLDKSAGEFSQERDVLPTCDISPLTHGVERNSSGSTDWLGKQLNSKSIEALKMWEMCPEGTYCACPMTEVRGWPSLGEIRERKRLAYIKRGVAGVPSIIAQFPMSYAGSATVSFLGHNAIVALAPLVPGLASIQAGLGVTAISVPAALSASIAVPTFIVTAGLALGAKAAWKKATFSCQSTVGCWAPLTPEWTSNGTTWQCRMPEEVKEGGSPLWFLPPPTLMLRAKNGKCKVRTCKEEDLRMERVGFLSSQRYGKNAFVQNCQPLAFEEMQGSQREAFVQKLRETGVGTEYDLGGIVHEFEERSESLANQLESDGRNRLMEIS